jgi:predicted MFS family arabinose efflux permease
VFPFTRACLNQSPCAESMHSKATVQRAKLLISVCVGTALAHIGTSSMPLQIGAVIDASGRSASASGTFGFCEVGALALSMIVVAPWIAGISPRGLAVIGSGIAAAANALLFTANSLLMQLVLGSAAGIGYGIVFAATVAGAAATDQPDRVYALGNLGALLMIVGLMTLVPTVSRYFGPLGIFLTLALLALISTAGVLGFRHGKQPAIDAEVNWKSKGTAGLLFAWAFFSTGTGAVYAFSERVGRGIPLAEQTIATLLSAGVFVGMLGASAAVVLGNRANRRAALLVGILGTGFACLVLGFAAGMWTFAIGIFSYWIFYMFLYSYLLGTAAILDRTGRIGALGGGTERLGYAIGAGLGGLMAQRWSYASTGLLGFAGCVLGAAVGYPSLFAQLSKMTAHEVSSNPVRELA